MPGDVDAAAGRLAGAFLCLEINFTNPLTCRLSYGIIKSWKQPPGTAGRRKMKEFKATIVDGTQRKNVTIIADNKYTAAIEARRDYYNNGGSPAAFVTNVREY